ncbi:MAG: glycosyltransferase [Planctomycetota bacterium]|jgi:glycosyltransferase involved in cell wall biosynthesis
MSNARFMLRYYANVRFPSERANSIQIVQMCSAFHLAGLEVRLCHPWRINRFTSKAPTIHAHYGVPENFALKKLVSLDLIDLLPRALQPPAFRLQSFTYGMRALFDMKRHGEALFYIRDNATLAVAASLLPQAARRRLFYEAHDFPQKAASARALLRAASQCGGVIAITRGLAERFEEAGLARDRLHVAPDGVDLARFEDLPGRAKARARLGLAVDVPLALYTGQLFDWKGVDTLVRAAAHFTEGMILLVGGAEKDRHRLAEVAAGRGLEDRVIFKDPVPPQEIPVHLCAADLLVLPNSGRFPISAQYTSPMKLFEYMAACRPIVASDLPSLKEVLRHEENALLVPADDPESLGRAMVRLLTEPALGDRLAACAGREAGRYGWEERARGIKAFMEGKLKA